jgi:hypothetical protein
MASDRPNPSHRELDWSGDAWQRIQDSRLSERIRTCAAAFSCGAFRIERICSYNHYIMLVKVAQSKRGRKGAKVPGRAAG